MDIKTGIPLGTIFFMLMQFSLFTVCFSLLIALATRSKNAVTAIIIGFSTIGCILGGAYFSLDMAPDPLQKMARVLPQYWFMDAFRRIQADPLANIYPNVIIITLFIILSFLIGAVLFSQQYKNS
jgi:ABC-2 type transport system permease protein